MSEPREAVILHALLEVAARAAAAGRLEPPAGEAVLRSVVEAAATLFDAQAASIALPDNATDRLVIRAAAGPAGDGAVGLSFNASEGIAGYVFTTGQPLAVADVATDPRFDRRMAESTGFVPRSILAVPLAGETGTVGVLEVLDRRGDGSSGLRDLDIAAVFARQAVVALRASRIERDAAELLRLVLVRLAEDTGADRAALDEAVAAVAAGLDDEDGDRLWALADAVARARRAAPDQVALVIEILDALARRGGRPGSRSFRR
jgi:GAF domain-containing protein